MKKLVRVSFIVIMMLSLLLAMSCSDENGENNENNNNNEEQDELPVATDSMIIGHLCTDLDDIPDQWITKAKSDLHIAYGHTSHGSQITTGMTGLASFANAPNGAST